MSQLYANNAASYLASGVGGSSTDKVIFIVLDQYTDRFPDILSSEDFFLVTMENVEDKTFEIVKVTAFNKTTGKMDIVRNQEQSVVKAFPQGSKVQLRVTKETLERLRDYANTIAVYEHNQKIAATQWIVTHNLGRRPAVTIQEGTWSGGLPDEFTRLAEVEAEVIYEDVGNNPSTTHLIINFSEPVIGRAICT